MSAHARLAPSAMPRTVPCPGSVQAQEAYPETEQSEASIEGTQAHAVMALYLGHPQPLDFEPTQEMHEGAQLVCDHVMRVTGGIYPLRVEQRVDIFGIHPENWGTPDISCWVGNVLHVWDYKFGHGFVDAFENWQLVDYVGGLLEEAAPRGLLTPATEVHMHVIQPRNYDREGPVRTWVMRVDALRPYFDRLVEASKEALSLEPRLISGGHCRDCRARHGCSALLRSVYKDADVVHGVRLLNMTPHAAALDLRFLHGLQARVKALVEAREEQVGAMLRRGESVPFWGMEASQGREEWQWSPAQVNDFAQMLNPGIQLYKEPDLITPNQARKLGLNTDMLPGAVDRKRGVKLVEKTDDTARKIFSN